MQIFSGVRYPSPDLIFRGQRSPFVFDLIDVPTRSFGWRFTMVSDLIN